MLPLKVYGVYILLSLLLYCTNLIRYCAVLYFNNRQRNRLVRVPTDIAPTENRLGAKLAG